MKEIDFHNNKLLTFIIDLIEIDVISYSLKNEIDINENFFRFNF